MSDDFKNKELERALEKAEFFPLKESAKARIHEALMEEANKYEVKKQKRLTYGKTAVWFTSIAAALILCIFALSQINMEFKSYSRDGESGEAVEEGSYDHAENNTAETESAKEEPSENEEVAEESEEEFYGDTAQESADQGGESLDMTDSVTPEFIKNNLSLNMTQDKVTQMFGDEFTQTFSAKSGNDMWRYDFGVSPGYTPYEEVTENGEVLDTVDIEGLENEKVDMQLFIEWDEKGTVLGYALYQWDSATDSLDDYRERQ